MTPNAQHKRAERERRKAAGDRRMECWMSADNAVWIDKEVCRTGATVSEVIQDAIDYMRITD